MVSHGRAFLRARWTNLFLATYAVEPDFLRPRLPPGLELDLIEEHAFVSLVAFDFLDTRVLGVPWPGFRNFPELNLRFYVRHGEQRGVVFVREFVPKRLVAWLARALYNEPYSGAPMVSTVRDEPGSLLVEHRLTWGGRTHTLRVTGAKPAFRPEPTSLEHFFKEHQWGFNTTRSGRTARYEVRHLVWDVYPVRNYHINLDWQTVYGPEWARLQDETPYSTVLAAGSEVAVYPKGTL
jgi:uncharacterized protein YqjF (DUF2071 family)